MAKISKKVIKIELVDHRVYEIEAHKVIHSRSYYYATKETTPGDTKAYDRIYKEEYEFLEGDKSEITDWMMNEMDWHKLNPRLVADNRPELKDAEVDDYYVEDK